MTAHELSNNFKQRICVQTSTPLIPYRLIGQLLTISAGLLALLPDSAPAASWEKLVRTGPCEVAFDTNSVRPATSGKVGVWLKYTPRGESGRRQAAAEYGNTAYRLHLEHYEIDCDNDSAVMGLRDIIGSKGKRLLRQTAAGKPETIIPGSELDQVARRICPAAEEESEIETDDNGDKSNATSPERLPETGMEEHARQRITEALKRTGAVPADPTAWTELGNAYFDTDMPREAIEAYNRSLALKPDNVDVLNDQGAMFRQTGDITQALKNFERAFTLDQRNLESLYNMGYMYAFDLHNIERALEVWQHYLKLDHSSETARQVQSFIDRYGH